MSSTEPRTPIARLYRLNPVIPTPPNTFAIIPPINDPTIPIRILRRMPWAWSVFIMSDAIQPVSPPNRIQNKIDIECVVTNKK
jgi:hypothetical protein